MSFLDATYSGVTWWQLAAGWFMLAFVVFPLWAGTIAKYVSIARKLKHLEWIRDSQWSAADYGAMIKSQRAKIQALEAQITRITVRPRGKNGRFEKKSGTEK